jgi:hypothetical protein
MYSANAWILDCVLVTKPDKEFTSVPWILKWEKKFIRRMLGDYASRWHSVVSSSSILSCTIEVEPSVSANRKMTVSMSSITKMTSMLVPRDPCRLGTAIHLFIVETSRMYKPACYNFVVALAVFLKTRIMCMYVHYTLVLVPGEPLRS